MQQTLTQEQQQAVVSLYHANATVNEIAQKTGLDPKAVLFYLTGQGLWSEFCSGCVLKRCYDCRGLSELGKPISIQDEVNLLATLRKPRATNDRQAT
jgi:hypothetical protein